MKMHRASAVSILFAFATPVALLAQAPPINYQSTEIHPDHTITFRYKDPGATKVMLNIRDLPKPIAMEKGADGIWTVTTQSLPPAIYNYIFLADGESRLDPALAADHLKRFQQALLTEVLPQVEATYHVARDRDHRAIAGLSMGGQESLTIGLTNTDKFAYVIGLSSAAQGLPTNPALANLNPKDANLRLLWISCGTEDSLSEPNHKLADWLKSKGMTVDYVQTPGVHSWIVWQDNLIHFAPLLFQSK